MALDCLQDTRLATVARINPSAAAAVLHEGYHTRKTDVFAHVDMELYKKLYAERDVETLKRSAPTECFMLIRELVKLLVEQNETLNSPYRDRKLSIVVNVYPYRLSPEELEAIGTTLASRLGGVIPVELVSLSPAELTPAYVRNNFAMLVMYEYDEWLSLHYSADPATCDLKEFLKTLLHDVTLFAPAIERTAALSQEELEEVKKIAGEEIFSLEVVAQLASAYIGLQLIDVTLFSVIRPQRPA